MLVLFEMSRLRFINSVQVLGEFVLSVNRICGDQVILQMTNFAFINQLIRCETNDLRTLPADSKVSAAVNAVRSFWRKRFENTKKFATNSP